MPTPPKTTTSQPTLPIDAPASKRDQIPTQGPGSAAGLVGDNETRDAFVSGAPIVDGKAQSTGAVDGQTDQSTDTPTGPQPQREPSQDQQRPQPANQPARVPLAFYPTNTDEMWRYAAMLANSDLLPRALKDKQTGRGIVANIHLVLMKGHDLGLKPMQSLGQINVIEGKAEVGALLMVALIRKSGACESWRLVHSDDRSAVYSTKRAGDSEPTEFEYTIEEADQMGLLDKGKSDWAKENNQWKKQPRTMLRRRCQSMLAREVYPDVVNGMYDHDEISEMHEVAARLDLHPSQVGGAIDVNSEPRQGALPPASEMGPIERALREQPEQVAKAKMAMADVGKPADPLKERLAARSAAGGRVRRCSKCDCTLDPRDSDPCVVCMADEP